MNIDSISATEENSRSKNSLQALLLHLHPRKIPSEATKITYTFCLGGLALWMFVLETVTGILLMLHYAPTVSGAYFSIQTITHVAPYGFFIRNLHYWCGQVMVVLVFLHMIRVAWTESYRSPRQLNWIIGVALLVFTVLIDFTGYLLVWDDRSLWALTIARNLAAEAPIVGGPLSGLLFGPAEVSDLSLIRVYVWHVFIFALLMIFLMFLHFWKIRKDGITRPL
jgi:cytochrome b6